MTPDNKPHNQGSQNHGPSQLGPDGRQADRLGLSDFSVYMPEPVNRRSFAARHILFAGVAGACVLGAGLGLWARPAMNERRAAAAPEADAADAARPDRKLQIVVDNRPPPLSAPIEVLPANSKAAINTTPPLLRSEPEPQAPARPPGGLMRVQTIAAPAPTAEPEPEPEPPAKSLALPKLAPLVVAALAEARSVEHKLATPRPPVLKVAPDEPAPAHLAKAAATPKPAHKAELAQTSARATAKAAAAKAAAHRIELAKAARAEKLEQLQLAKAEKAEAFKLAKAEAKGRAEARAEAKAEALAEAREEARKEVRLASLARAVRQMLPHPAKAPAPVETAKLDRKHLHKARPEPRIEQASLKARKVPHPVEPPSRTHAVNLAPPPQHPSGLMKVSTPRCASRDPGEALVCADPSLGAADRQLVRAYQDARAAGVPDAQLQRQQQRWLAARSAAAREAPWAVHDVYLARIAELTGQAREAHGDGY